MKRSPGFVPDRLLGVLGGVMILAALLESGAGAVHAINERISGAVESRGRPALGAGARALIGAAILTGCMFVAGEIGLVDLIASGYRFLAWLFLAVFVVPLLTLGTWRLLRPSSAPPLEAVP